jgi:hypothetical protein
MSAERKKSDPGESKFYCSAEWHYARFKHQFAGVVHSHALRLAQKSNNYYCSIADMAEYFHKDERTIADIFHELAERGWFEVINRDAGHAVNYRPIPHKSWAASHPHQCVEKGKKAQGGASDPLGAALFSISGGRATKVFFPNVLKGFRSCNFTDDEIIQEWTSFLSERFELEIQARVGFRGISKRFKEFLKMKWALYSQQAPSSHMGGSGYIA